ncbi:MAG TPA: alpha/beta hydrolase [Acidimicrobiia bacterium]|nr:alpha/beta hydrolase [Acidimicrobiia bacterium]
MGSLELAVGDLVFEARADGPDDGALVVLLHGFPETSLSWRHQLPALAAAGYRAVAPDQRGYSPRARPTDVGEYRFDRLTSDVLGFADALGVERFHLVGHDWGGAVAWQVAGRHPDRLDTVTSVSTPHPAAFRHAIRDGDQRDRSGYIQFFRTPEAEPFFLDDDATGLRALYTASSMPEEAVEEYVRVLTQPGAMTGALNWYRAADLGLVEGLGPITTPTMYVWSTSDPALGPDAAEATADHVAGPYRFEVLEGVSHWIPEHAAETLNALLLAHLRGTL